ncbi:MAG: DUF3306 domain-containing protein [Hoeflea sp.]|uniref:DUF3306 domain-containing protein n=1 Tax=Hoeflea sp. TaxID=1940281 RepID=UPI003EF155C3
MVEDKEGFLSRWSKRKQAQLSNPDVDPDAEMVAVDAVEVDEEQLEAERSEAEVNRLAAEAVDLAKVEYGFDFSIFMKRGVPDLLRKQALKKFFNSNPVLANLDGLNDYDEDYNNPLHMVYKSSWDVGRGFLTEAEKILQQATGRLTRDEPPAVLDSADDSDGEQDEEEQAQVDGEAMIDGAASSGEDTELAGTAEPTDATAQTDDVADPDPEPLQQKRVSIRQRLNG